MGLLNAQTIDQTDFINKAGANADPALDVNKVPKLEVTGKFHPDFISLVPVNIQEFIANGTWTKPPQGSFALIEIIAGGASGGATKTTSSSNAAAGGSGGAYRQFLVRLSELAATETATIGAGGAAVTANAANTNANGLNGAVSWFKSTVFQANGGIAGTALQGSILTAPSPAGGAKADLLVAEAGGVGGAAATGNLSADAGLGGVYAGAGGGAAVTNSNPNSNQGLGGLSVFLGSIGGNGAANTTTADLVATAGIRGGGGGGAAKRNATGNVTSGVGGNGFIRVTVF